MLCAMLGASLLVLVFFDLFVVRNKSDPCMVDVGEIHAPLFPRILFVKYFLLVSSYCFLVYLLLELISFYF